MPEAVLIENRIGAVVQRYAQKPPKVQGSSVKNVENIESF
jgi:hypothetical protein